MRSLSVKRLALLPALVFVLLASDSARGQPRTLTLETDYQAREASAPPAIKARIAAHRVRVAAAHEDTLFAFTSVSGLPIAKITGYVEPADPIKEMRTHNTKYASQLAQATAQVPARVATARPKLAAQRLSVSVAAQPAMMLASAQATVKSACEVGMVPQGGPPGYDCASEDGYKACIFLMKSNLASTCNWVGHDDKFAKHATWPETYHALKDGCVPRSNNSLECWNITDYNGCQTYLRGHSLAKCTFEPPSAIVEQSANIPSRFDWREAHILPPIRDQKQCGSCWAFSAVGTVEASMLLEAARRSLIDGKPLFPQNHLAWKTDTAEQQVLSCSGAGTCDGGGITSALEWTTGHPLFSEASFPYTATDQACKPGTSTGIRALLVGFIDPDVLVPSRQKLKTSLLNYGPLAIAIYVNDAFQDYAGGVLHSFHNGPNGTRQADGHMTNHAIMLVGWDDAKNAWLIRNSWGHYWGSDAGFSDAYRTYSSTNTAETQFTAERGYAWIEYDTMNLGAGARFVVPAVP